MHLFTSISANYLPKARVLAQSAKKNLARHQFHVILCDDLPDWFDIEHEPFDSVITIDELPIPHPIPWIFGHTVVELCTAVKGLAFLEIAKRYAADEIFYFDPDIVIFSNLESLIDKLDCYSILLTPHLTEPEQSLDGIIDHEIGTLKHGIFNLGFLGVRTDDEGMRLLRWWSDRLLKFCYDDIPDGLFTDQRWIDLAPSLFENIYILRDPNYNVATWNLSNRYASGSLKYGIMINGLPLGFYHFSGFDSGAQEVMLKKYAGTNPTVWELREWYIAECARKGQQELGDLPCRFAYYDNGQMITKEQRIVYRSRIDLQQYFPQPFQTSVQKESYYHWYQANIQPHTMGNESAPELKASLLMLKRELDLIKGSRSWRLASMMAKLYRKFGPAAPR